MTTNRLPFAALLIAMASLASGCITVHNSHLDGCLAQRSRCSDLCIIFVESAVDVGQWGKLPEIADYFACCGVDTVYYDPYADGCCASDLAERVRYERCRHQHVMLVSWSVSTYPCLDALQMLAEDGVCIDTLFVIDCPGINLWYGYECQPANVCRVVWCKSLCSPEPKGFDCLVLHNVDTCNHLQVPGHPMTINALFCEAIRLTGGRMYSPAPEPLEMAPSQSHEVPPSPFAPAEEPHLGVPNDTAPDAPAL
jgi:hypothetical protein